MRGRRLDRYELVEPIGSGGMAVVYLARDLLLERDVAIKVLHPHLAAKEESRLRFTREAHAVARLRHPSIVEIFDFSGHGSEQSYIVTELVQGRTLRAFGDEVGFPLPELAAMAGVVLGRALAHAHDQGVIHRDLKPENVMVRDDGALKLMDFGIARMIGSEEQMTLTGALMGSPHHMAPEIIEGKEVGVAADLFSLGTILYWMTTGKMPFDGNNPTHTLQKILEGDFVDPRLLAPACPEGLAEVIATCLRRDPGARYPSAGALVEALCGVLAEVGIDRHEEELAAFLLAPGERTPTLRAEIRAALLLRAEEAVTQGRQAKALAHLDRLLALDPEDERARELLQEIRRKGRMRTWGLATVGGVAAAGLLLFMVSQGGGPTPSEPPSAPPAAARDAPASAPEEGDAPVPAVARVDPRDPTPAARPDPPQPAEPQEPARRDPLQGTAPREPALAQPADTEDGLPAPGGDRPDGRAAPGSDATAPGAPDTPSASQRAAEALAEDAPRGDEGGAEATVAEAEVEAAEAGEPREVHLRWVPQGATLYLDGRRVETIAPTWKGALPVGEHRLALIHSACCHPHEEVLEVEPGDEPIRRSIALQPKESGWFDVSCDDPEAEVWLEGSFRGTVAEVRRRGGVAVAFSKEDMGRDRYVKTVQFDVLPPQGADWAPLRAEVVVRAGQRTESPPLPCRQEAG